MSRQGAPPSRPGGVGVRVKVVEQCRGDVSVRPYLLLLQELVTDRRRIIATLINNELNLHVVDVMALVIR